MSNDLPLTGSAKSWGEEQVWVWLKSKPYVGDLKKASWKYTDGATLLGLDVAGATALGVPLPLIPRLLKDIKELQPSEGLYLSTSLPL
jgi:hypothetical protein